MKIIAKSQRNIFRKGIERIDMLLKEWENLPESLRCDEVRPYYDILKKKQASLIIKRIFDLVVASMLLILFAIPMLVIAIMIKLDSPGSVFYRQERVTQYGRKFRIHKFRTMVADADKIGTAVTVGNDSRITRVGAKIRDYRIDELPQLIDVLVGDMSFVGTRPEAVKYVRKYTKEMRATLLLPAGITSEASIRYKDEAKLLDGADDVDRVYVEQVLPEKMKWNLKSVEKISLVKEFKTMIWTILAVVRK